MNKVAQYYQELVSSLTERINKGEHDIDTLVESARQRMNNRNELSSSQIDDVARAVRRDLEEFARSYTEKRNDSGDSVFMRIIRESVWKELADITDKSQLEWREIFQDLNHHGVYQSGEVVGLGRLVCEQCQFSRAIYTPETLTRCPECGNDQFQRLAFEP